jgi:peptidoglycan-associated lipoprotein
MFRRIVLGLVRMPSGMGSRGDAMEHFIVALTLLFVVAGSTACASKGFVGTSVGDVNDKVETLAKSVETTQERARKNEAQISEVDQKAQSAQRSAQQADQAARQASQIAADASTIAKAAEAKADAVDRASRKLVYEVVISSDSTNFQFAKSELPEAAKKELDDLVTRLKQDGSGNVFIEIEGHTDSSGSKMVNQRIGLERAEAVEQYLYEQHQIPLHRMNVISYGEEKPIAPNSTRVGRAMNRRVVVKVLS